MAVKYCCIIYLVFSLELLKGLTPSLLYLFKSSLPINALIQLSLLTSAATYTPPQYYSVAQSHPINFNGSMLITVFLIFQELLNFVLCSCNLFKFNRARFLRPQCNSIAD